MLEKLLRALGLSEEAVDDLMARIEGWQSGDPEGERDGPRSNYRLRDDFLSPAEHSFYLVLRQAVESWAIVAPKVGLSDLFFTTGGDRRANWAAWNRINRKHVDFLLLDKVDARPLIGVELDDRSHQRRDRQERDRLVDRVFAEAGLPLAHIGVRHAYPVAELGAGLRRRAGVNGGQSEPAIVSESEVATQSESDVAVAEQVPHCPSCGVPMVLRTARRGGSAGNQFWGCSNYPRCRETVAF
jgi:hypothetical protein